ncbi:SusC/RagA family TonB-linked outer membrane protein [Cellulophaga sp. HaHaR_3_176]|uniref:SusC/RagA family TonB-linked outer membrane protein n=1 Tax=Cellulophaga sp. HaHaR_3_176 TaxID=1942464 RepID=UPI001C1F8619|nr:SusC/RagA family TonB-linked outer membrane protein [Cellulophaga sp. HaHaR_3_176]QWX82689.1 SusC/RagA family TonB-linked outer membrane protein [Cellulophaga sp. HaHaR_3_176]
MKKALLMLTALFFCANGIAQNVTGEVKDQNGGPLPGVTVLITGTTVGTTTDFDGNFEIAAAIGDVLRVSYLGMKSKDIKISSNSRLSVVLEEDASALDEVVVTAFGVEKKQKSLGYSVTQVKAENLNLAGQSNAIESLQGRVAGVQINRTSGTSGGGVDILIRGVTSVNPNRSNQPLIIVDGIALNNDTFSGEVRPSSGSNSASSSEQFAFSNRAGDINPEDIESFNVLKGAAATALYGVRASNGAIIITTKKGKKGKAKISLTASTTFRNINKTPSLQTTYREGYNGLPRTLYDPTSETGFNRVENAISFYNWGPEYAADSATLSDGTIVDLTGDQFYSPYDLFRTGFNSQVNLSISGADEKLDYFFSLGNNSEEGVLPNTDYEKTNFRLNSGYKVTDNFNINTSISYTNSGGKRANGGDKSVMSALSFYSSTFPINDYKNADGSERDYSFGIIDNPRYLMETSSLIDDVNRWVGNATFNWAPKDWVNITYAAQVDNYSDKRNRFVGADLDGGSQVGGFILNQNINFTALESNFLVAFNKDWSDKFTTDLTLGHQVSDSKRDYAEARGEGLNVPGINEIGNTTNFFINNTVTQLRNMGVFGELKLGYDDKLFLTLTGRNDWLSTLPKENRSFFYPSASLAYDISDVFGDNNVFTFGKLRASWAEVGKGPGFGDVGQYFIVDGDFPFGGSGGYRRSTQLGDLEIVPERNQSTEFGADLRFAKDRIRLDYAYYETRVKDQIFTVGTGYSSGLSGITRNAGDFEVFGHELLISANIIQKKDFKWDLILNWSTSEGKVLEIPDDIESIIFADSGFVGVTSEIRAGDKMGSLYGYKWTYVDGERYIAPDGLPVINLDERVKVGNAFPDFVSSIGSDFKWKGIGFNFLLEYKKGGDLYDSGLRNSIRNGNPLSTLLRDELVVLDGVMDDGIGGYVTNTREGLIDQDYYRNENQYNRASEVLVQDASWVKLRNISLSYDFDSKFISSLNLSKVSISASANNILIWTPFDGFDPEGNQYSAGSNVYGFTGLSVPISESYSLGINIGF